MSLNKAQALAQLARALGMPEDRKPLSKELAARGEAGPGLIPRRAEPPLRVSESCPKRLSDERTLP